MGDFRNNRGTSGFGSEGRSRGSKFGGGSRGGFGGGRSGGFGGGRGRDSGFSDGPREMHDATCDKCKKQCQVPFRPSGGKPIYCSDCFRSNGGDSRSNDSRQNFAPRSERTVVTSPGISPDQFAQLNKKLDKILNVLEQLEIEVVEGEDDESEDDDDSEDEEEGK